MLDTNSLFGIASPLLGYAGPLPGIEFLPYLLSLLAFVGTALVAAVQWPLAMLRQCFGRKNAQGATAPSTPASASEV